LGLCGTEDMPRIGSVSYDIWTRLSEGSNGSNGSNAFRGLSERGGRYELRSRSG
jgi:hypothetical protein